MKISTLSVFVAAAVTAQSAYGLQDDMSVSLPSVDENKPNQIKLPTEITLQKFTWSWKLL